MAEMKERKGGKEKKAQENIEKKGKKEEKSEGKKENIDNKIAEKKEKTDGSVSEKTEKKAAVKIEKPEKREERVEAKKGDKKKKKKQDGPSLYSLRAFRRVGAALPEQVTKPYAEKLKQAGIKKDIRVWLGSRLLLSFFIGSIFLLLYMIIYNPTATIETSSLALVLFFGGFVLVMVLAYLHLYFKIINRAGEVEKILPDFLLLTVSNLRAGMSPFQAFVRAARPEFGALHEEIRLSTARSGGKASLVVALQEVAENFDSEVLRRTVNLFGKGIHSGGQISKLLESSANEVRGIQDLREELATSTRTYAVFLGFILVFIMPFLLSVSTHFVSVFTVIEQENTRIGGGGPAAVPIFSGTILVSAGEMVLISIVTLTMTSLLVAALIGIIRKGRALYGVKYFPIFAVSSVIMFFVTRAVIGSLLSSFGSPG